MHDNVEPSDNDGLPLFTMTREDYRFTQILVVKNVEETVYDILFIGTDNGKVLKVVIMTINGKLQSNLIDEITVTDPEKPEPVVSMEFIGNQTDKFILVGTPSGIVLINVQRCGELKECGCVQDPYCGWDGNSKTCKIYKPNIIVKQNITARENCPVEEITCECPEPPTVVPGRTEKDVDPSSDCTALTVIAIIGWILLAILGSILIIYFCFKRARQRVECTQRESRWMSVNIKNKC
ncbi:semaphorin-3D-like isoform X5 [Ptychodera flava]|uniref:semaphorin-3D-like isoform X5 n=1 Tax=Ptychodera flava TaxID=63121 RepID=UPI00396A64FE